MKPARDKEIHLTASPMMESRIQFFMDQQLTEGGTGHWDGFTFPGETLKLEDWIELRNVKIVTSFFLDTTSNLVVIKYSQFDI
jgi:hypothetical protein